MQVRALVDFHDNLEGMDRKAGDVFKAAEARVEQINAVGMEKISAPIVERLDLSSMKKDELFALAGDADPKMTKAQLIALLEED